MPYKDPALRKAKGKEYSKAYYERNKAKVIQKTTANKRKTRAQWTAFKATLACIQCGENHPAALDFHHVVRSTTNRKVYRLISGGQWAAALEEIKKCVVLCANCHRKVHHEERVQARLVRKQKKVAKKAKTS